MSSERNIQNVPRSSERTQESVRERKKAFRLNGKLNDEKKRKKKRIEKNDKWTNPTGTKRKYQQTLTTI